VCRGENTTNKDGKEKDMLRAGLFGLTALLASTALSQAQTPVARGDYLVNAVLTCGNCHSPKAQGGVEARDKLFSGGVIEWDTPAFKVKGPNITPDADTGIGKWTDAQIKSALQNGKHPDGHPLAPIMPFAFYKVFTPGDLDAVVAYLKSVPAINNKTQAPVYKTAMHVDVVPDADKPATEADLRDPVKRGHYLVTIAHCMECHTPMERGERLFSTRYGAGGFRFTGPFGESFSRNITSHKEKGIGAWNDDEIKRAITHGVRKDGTKLKPPMGYEWYARMTDADLSAIVAYLRTVPPKE
jgi:mono/diheme cytochrome c family protein